MSEDEPFLRAIRATPRDRLVRLVYADWLDERGDPRAEYLRLQARCAELTPGHGDTPAMRQRMAELRASLPADWVALLEDYAATNHDGVPDRTAQAAAVLNRPVQFLDSAGYEMEITAAAVSLWTQAVAYVESRSKWIGELHDIRYHLRLRDPAGRTAEWEVESYNPYFGCDVRFLEWFGDVAVMIYEEKHDTYVCRFGMDSPAVYKVIEDEWVLSTSQLGHWGYKHVEVQRLTLPDLAEMPPLSEADAERWMLLPRKYW
jgi:uncharacterized protein (TIGR02996 family)